MTYIPTSNADFPARGAIPLSQHAAESTLSGHHWLHRFRVQLPTLVVGVLLLQFMTLYARMGAFDLIAPVWVSLLATQIANVAGALSFRAVQRVPGTRKLGFILPTITASYGVLIFAAFAFRVPYSVLMIGVGYAGALAILWAFNSLARPGPNGGLHIVLNDQTRELMNDLPQLPFHIMESPRVLAGLTTGAVIVDLREDLASDWEREIARAVLRGLPVYHVKQAHESLTGKVRFDHLSENHFGSLVPSLGYLALKRAIDLIVSTLALVALCLPMLAIAGLIRFTSAGPAIFKHSRVGYRGEPFIVFKFRTMKQSKCDNDDRESQITLAADPRITALGRFLRETRLDELPQLINVLKGEMSLIGPRPEAQALSEWYGERLDFYEYRHVVRPGITGWAQINQGHVTSIEDVFHKTQYDFYYIKNLSPSMDFLIALKTIEIMFSRRGSR
ncbi:sugar transferase [Croceibacterium sp. LX-88]|uniref:Sugar transferase n=1 Tax=Croceibacterium selenioxidans TaxID=2838833 RepID=A0ABS5W1C0_9SPHN|nr:sugar transferase [Croceibacterium selenioxidans]MBT2133565.1 sugar transferase [Croceibacterium selenioxidans]